MFVYLQSQNRSYRSELPARRVGRSVRSFEIFAIRDVPKDERSAIWSDGRVARQRSAKPCTAVRIRFRPHRNRVAAIYNAVLFLNCHTFVIPTFIRGWFLQYKITSYRYPGEFGGLLDSFYHLILAIVFGLHLV